MGETVQLFSHRIVTQEDLPAVEGPPAWTFEYCDLRNLNFEDMDLTNVRFIHCRIYRCSFSRGVFGAAYAYAAFIDCGFYNARWHRDERRNAVIEALYNLTLTYTRQSAVDAFFELLPTLRDPPDPYDMCGAAARRLEIYDEFKAILALTLG